MKLMQLIHLILKSRIEFEGKHFSEFASVDADMVRAVRTESVGSVQIAVDAKGRHFALATDGVLQLFEDE